MGESLFMILFLLFPPLFLILFFATMWPTKSEPEEEFRTPRGFRTWELELAVRRAEALLERHSLRERLRERRAAWDAEDDQAKEAARG